jgi:hypothetical protein
MIVWLWSASGPGNYSGVTGDDQAARNAASECIVNGHAKTATVEQASLALGVSSLTDTYQRTGTGWTGRRSDRGIRWTRLTRRAAS